MSAEDDTPNVDVPAGGGVEARLDALEQEVERVDSVARVNRNIIEHLVETYNVDDAELVKIAVQTSMVTAGDLDDEASRISREQAEIRRRLVGVEDELGVEPVERSVVEAGRDVDDQPTRLGRLVQYGAESVSDNPTEVLYRAKVLFENWGEWGTYRSDAFGRERRLASKKHHLLTHLEAERGESLQWTQVYRAMEKVAELSDGVVELDGTGGGEGQYVLVQQIPEDEDG